VTDDLARRIDHTLLEKDAPATAYDELAETADRLGMNVCVPPCHVERVSEVVSDDREVAAVVGFHHGTATTETKAFEACDAVDRGATEVDAACNVSALLSGDNETFAEDVRRVVEAVPETTTKFIVEMGLLDDEEKRRATRLCAEAGADYVKTCTGFTPGDATVEDVRLIDDATRDDVLVKASGGIRDAETALEMLEAGASRIGTSSGEEILRDYSR